jgi:hypothetical protein
LDLVGTLRGGQFQSAGKAGEVEGEIGGRKAIRKAVSADGQQLLGG